MARVSLPPLGPLAAPPVVLGEPATPARTAGSLITSFIDLFTPNAAGTTTLAAAPADAAPVDASADPAAPATQSQPSPASRSRSQSRSRTQAQGQSRGEAASKAEASVDAPRAARSRSAVEAEAEAARKPSATSLARMEAREEVAQAGAAISAGVVAGGVMVVAQAGSAGLCAARCLAELGRECDPWLAATGTAQLFTALIVIIREITVRAGAPGCARGCMRPPARRSKRATRSPTRTTASTWHSAARAWPAFYRRRRASFARPARRGAHWSFCARSLAARSSWSRNTDRHGLASAGVVVRGMTDSAAGTQISALRKVLTASLIADEFGEQDKRLTSLASDLTMDASSEVRAHLARKGA